MMLHRPRILIYVENVMVGGAERYLRDLVRGLVDRHCDVRIGCNAHPALVQYVKRMHGSVPVDVLPVKTMTGSAAFQLGKKTGAGNNARLQPLRSIIADGVRLAHFGPSAIVLHRWLMQYQPDILHINNGGYPGSESCRVAAVAGRLAHVPVVSMFVHSQAGRVLWPYIQETALDRLISQSLDTILTSSRASADTLVRRRGFPRSKMICISNGIELPQLLPALSPIERRQLGLPASGTLIGTVGRIDYNKGQNYLLEAIARVRRDINDVYAVIVGTGPQEDEFRARARDLGIGERAIFTGQRHDVSQLLRALDVFVMPSVEYEGLGYALLEAMAAGLPVIVHDVGGMPEAVENGKAGLVVPPCDTDALARTLMGLVNAPIERRRLGQAARARIEREYKVDCMVNKTLDHYLYLLDKASEPAWGVA